MKTFETERFILRPWEEEDAEDLYAYAKDPQVGPAAGWPAHTSVENSREIIRDILSEEGTFAVCLKETGQPIGSIGLFETVQTKNQEGIGDLEVGYWIGVPFWGQGMIPEAVHVMLTYAFTELGAKAVWCGYYAGNEKSKRVQEKCGFKPQHVEEKYVPLLEEYRDEYFTRITLEEWNEKTK